MTNKVVPSLSVFFPAYNEEENIAKVISDATDYVPAIADKYEIIVINDGSSDNTAKIVQDLARSDKHIRLINHQTNHGYGSAVKSGIKAAKYSYVFFTDADRQFHFSELKEFVTHLKGADIVVGYRRKRQDPFLRIVIAQILLKYWNFLFFGLWMKDVDCAYKLIPTKYLKKLNLITESAITITEIMVKLKKQNYKIIETPVTHFPRQRGIQTGSNPKVILRAFVESFKLWQYLRVTK